MDCFPELFGQTQRRALHSLAQPPRILMTRVREARVAGASDREAIIEALGTTAQVITSAAAIMLVVFTAFTLGDF